VGSNPTEGMDVWCVNVFILCVCCPVFRYRPYDELITRRRSPKTKLNSVAFYSANKLYRPSDRRLSAKLVSTFAARGCRVVSATDPPAVISVFLTGAATFSLK
jgi:hypothetical protein